MRAVVLRTRSHTIAASSANVGYVPRAPSPLSGKVADGAYQHWTIHREFCRTGSANPHPGIMKDDGDPAWIDVGAFRPRVIPDKEHEHDWPLFAEREGAEIFVDIAHDSPYRKGDIFRIRTRTLSPACLKAYKRLWTSELPAAARKLIDGGGCSQLIRHCWMCETDCRVGLLDPPDNMGFPRRPT